MLCSMLVVIITPVSFCSMLVVITYHTIDTVDKDGLFYAFLLF